MERKHNGKRALLLVDFINLFDFPDAEKLAARGLEAARNAARLKERARADGIPCIYCNDNFGQWKSEFSRVVQECMDRGGAARDIATLLRPTHDDFSILKPRHSAFYGTPLEFLLDELEVETLVLAGLSADMCISATAQDAYVRQFRLRVPPDCVAADTADHEAQALDHMARTMKADIRLSTEGF
jgi:nicotinamidase-related amidase